ncbi:MAG: hypothetical protein WHS82_02735 [Candidatus Methanosuratincola sp.]
MSLTYFLKIPDVRRKFTETFPLPKCNLIGSVYAPPQSDHYALVGTAFDYLMRFYLKIINPAAKTKTWVAEDAVEMIQKTWVAEDAVEMIQESEFQRVAIDIITNSKKHYNECLETGVISKELIINCLQLAQLDSFYRAWVIDPNLGHVDDRDVTDLKNLLAIAKQRDFHAKTLCALNPTFGEASILVGGADADVLLDGTLIDIKTTKFLKLKKEYFHQLIGYYILFRIGGIDGIAEAHVDNLAVYYSRHGILQKMPVKEVIGSCDLDSFTNWFINRAKMIFINRAKMSFI